MVLSFFCSHLTSVFFSFQLEPNRFLCKICNEDILNANEARQHWRLKHSSRKKSASAALSPMSFHHDQDADVDGVREEDATVNGVDSGGGYKCDYCDYVASVPRNKLLHEKRVHLNMDCKTCARVLKDSAERASHVCVKPDRFQCSQCEKSYKVRGCHEKIFSKTIIEHH